MKKQAPRDSARFPGHALLYHKNHNTNLKMPVKHCIAVNCTSDSRRNKDLKFHPLPKVHAVRRMWLDLVKREGFGVKPGADIRHHVLCEKHFIDGHPTAENPLPTLFHYNTSMFNKKTPRKCKNFVVHRKVRDDLSVNGPQKNPAVKIDKLKLVKCTEDQRSRHCYPYITGEIDVLTSSTCVDRTTRHSCHDGTCSSGWCQDSSPTRDICSEAL